jgi:hypothetical protein
MASFPKDRKFLPFISIPTNYLKREFDRCCTGGLYGMELRGVICVEGSSLVIAKVFRLKPWRTSLWKSR